MIKKLILFENISITIMQFILYCIAFLEISYIVDKNSINYGLSLIIFVYLFISYFARKFSKNIAIFIITYIFMFLSNMVIPITNNERILLSLIVIVITFASIEYWFGRSSKPIISAPHISCEVIFILILLISDSTFEKFINVILFLGIIYLFLSILVFYIQNLKKYIKFNNIIEDLPISNVISGTNLALTYLLFIWFFILFLIKMLKIDKLFMFVIKPILQYIMSVIFTFLNYIGSFFGFSPELSLEPIDKQPEMTNIPKDNSSSYIDILLECLKVILVIVAIFSVAYLIYRYFKSKLSKNELATDIVENLHEGKKFKFNKKSSISQMNNPYENSNNINIRKAYFKKVSKIKLKIPSINKQLTHIEISREVSANSEYNITELTSLYEKARYSNITCTKKDVNKAKRL